MKKLLQVLTGTIFVILLYSSTSFGLDTNSIKYMPLQVGNFWVYNYTSTVASHRILKITVTNSVVRNNHLYYYLYTSYQYYTGFLENGYYRTDSITGSLYRYDTTNSCVNYYYEQLYDSLAANAGDSSNYCLYAGSFRCTGTVPAIIFNDSTYKISYYSYYSYGSYSGDDTKYYAKKYGFYRLHIIRNGGGSSSIGDYILKGCKINGIIYGDTSLTTVKNISSIIPPTYSISQNYPNPFNSTSNLKFQIVNTGNVKLIVYDIMGKEVQTLVNERLQPGTYEAAFDGSMLTSGVYFYKLIIRHGGSSTSTFTETKKMLLIK